MGAKKLGLKSVPKDPALQEEWLLRTVTRITGKGNVKMAGMDSQIVTLDLKDPETGKKIVVFAGTGNIRSMVASTICEYFKIPTPHSAFSL